MKFVTKIHIHVKIKIHMEKRKVNFSVCAMKAYGGMVIIFGLGAGWGDYSTQYPNLLTPRRTVPQ